MKVRCISNHGKDLRSYEYEQMDKNIFGRFGASAHTQYGIEIGQEYLVMGIFIYQTYQAYLIDDNGFILSCPCQLFEILDDKLDPRWCFRTIDKDENIYPFIQAVLGYTELCTDRNSYEDLIIEKNERAIRIYFERKIELENEGIYF